MSSKANVKREANDINYVTAEKKSFSSQGFGSYPDAKIIDICFNFKQKQVEAPKIWSIWSRSTIGLALKYLCF